MPTDPDTVRPSGPLHSFRVERGLITQAVSRCTKVRDFEALLTAMWDAGIAAATGAVLAEAARRLPDDRVLRLARVL